MDSGWCRHRRHNTNMGSLADHSLIRITGVGLHRHVVWRCLIEADCQGYLVAVLVGGEDRHKFAETGTHKDDDVFSPVVITAIDADGNIAVVTLTPDEKKDHLTLVEGG